MTATTCVVVVDADGVAVWNFACPCSNTLIQAVSWLYHDGNDRRQH